MKRATIAISVGYAFGFSLIVAIGTLVALSARAESPVMAIFAPGTSLSESISAVEDAGVRVTGFGPVGWIVSVAPLDHEKEVALRREGAWLFLDAARLAALCSPILASNKGAST